MTQRVEPTLNPADVKALGRWRSVQLRNLVDQQLKEAPWRTLAIVALLTLIWGALYFLLSLVLSHIHRWGLIGVVANQHLFVQFFLFLTIMLAFSNALLTFGSLFGRDEAGYLLTLPVLSRHVVLLKWLEGMFLSSWSFLLLGIPLMLAVAATSDVSWYFYPLFLGHFLGFVAVPACAGLLAAWAVARWAPRKPLNVAIGAGSVLLLSMIYWFTRISHDAMESELWLKGVFNHISLAQQPLLPSTWTAKGVVAAVQGRVSDSLFYLMIVLGNAAFLSWLTVNIIGATWPEAYSRAQHGRLNPTIRSGWITATICYVLFFYLPTRLRQVMLKDIRGLARDAQQWSQMLIMFGLLMLYVLNLRRLPLDLANPFNQGLIAFLNLTTVSLILATFTSRFVYPLLSLESQQLWLLGLLPLRRFTLLGIKFLFTLSIAIISAGSVIALAANVLSLPHAWKMLDVIACISVCIGLAGLSIGLGARFPLLGQRNPARIASSFGGTLNLAASMLFVTLEMVAVALISRNEIRDLPIGLANEFSQMTWVYVAGLPIFGALVAAVALIMGGRHFSRLEY